MSDCVAFWLLTGTYGTLIAFVVALAVETNKHERLQRERREFEEAKRRADEARYVDEEALR